MFKRPSARARIKGLRLVVGALLVALGLAGCAGAIKEKNAVNVVTIDGTISPVMARYVERAIGDAEDADAAAVVLRLDTPGGLDSSMRDIVQRIESSKVPVITYVWPPGARAASAGTFITMAGHIAAMAPNTAIGAAHPVGSSGEDIEGTMADKVTNDAVAYITGIAKLRGRNAEWAEDAVRESVSVDEEEAVRENVVDLVAPSLTRLLAEVDGEPVELLTGDETVTVTLDVADAPVVENDMSLVERALLIIADPNIAFILLSLGMLGLTFELIYPGGVFPGVFGVIALILAFYSLSILPTNWAGVALIILAFGLFVAELLVAGFGVLGVGGVISLILGGLLLTSTNDPEFQVSRWLIYGLAAVMAVFFLMVVSAILRSRRLPAVTGTQALIGRTAVVRSALEPEGQVFLEGERWTATAEDGPIKEGENVIVTAVHGLRLAVKRAAVQEEPPEGAAQDQQREKDQ